MTCPMRLNLPGLIHHNLKQSPYIIFWSSHPTGIHLTQVSLPVSPEKAQRRMLLIPLLQLQLLGKKNATLISSISYCQYKAGFPFQLSAPARCLPGSRGSPAPPFIWRALTVLQNVSSRREHPAPPAAPSHTDMITSITCGSPRWWPNSTDTCPEACFCTDSEGPDSSEHTRYLWPPATSSSQPGSRGHQPAELCPGPPGSSSGSTGGAQPHRYATTATHPCPIS